MKNNFDIKKFLIENKVTLNSKNISEQDNFELGDTDIELAKNFDIKYLKVGDIVTPDMWDKEKCSEMGNSYKFLTREPWIIELFEHINEPQMGEVYWLLILKGTRSGEIVDDMEEDIANGCLKDNYKFDFPLDVPDRVNEEFTLGDEDIELAKQLNVKYLKIGDTIEPEMWNQKSDAIWELHYIDINKPYKITDFFEDWDGIDDMDIESAQYVTLQDSNNKEEYEAVYWIKQALKPQFQLEVESLDLDEEFTLGPNDMELAKSFSFHNFDGDVENDLADWAIPILSHSGFDEDDINDYFKELWYHGDVSGFKNISPEEMIQDFESWKEMDDLNEEFELDDEDMELAKRLDYDPQYDLVLEIAKSYVDEDILQDFLTTFPAGEPISEEEFKDFFGQYVDDYGDWYYINQNWKYVESGGDESVFDEEEDDEDEDELDEEFTLGDQDMELAKSLDFIKVRFTRQDEADELNDMYDELGGERGMTPEQVLVMDADNLNMEGYFDNEVESLEDIANDIFSVQGGTVEKWLEALNDMVDLDVIEIYK
jgi:hypothetical protein